MKTKPTFPDLLARATKGPYTIDKDHPCFVEACKTVLCAAPTATDAELIRRALAFFAAGGYAHLKEIFEIMPSKHGEQLLCILDGEDAGTGEKKTKQS